MQKKSHLFVFLVLFFVFPAPDVFGQLRIGVIDLKKVFDDFHETKAYDAKLQGRKSEFSLNKDKERIKYQGANEAYRKLARQSKDPGSSASAIEKAKKSADEQWLEVKRIEQNLTQLDRVAFQNLQSQRERFREKILNRIMEVLRHQAKEKGFMFVFNISSEDANRLPIIAYQSGNPDLTTEVLNELNAGIETE
ncbi:MAG TPA: OmpH family outer membrane protein [Verrucomicrobiales bacterium]|nr:OmpH family outer membrane protein [Verrucomicrobiales bacterium]HIL70364.1 OmpH family outer membrane protein [Verrucomicrobiota bacterium]